MDGKVCSTCKEFKLLSYFGKSKREKDGLKHVCKSCRNESSRVYREKHKQSNPPINTFKIEPGMVFTSWTVVSIGEYKNNVRYWLCKCECGTVKEVSTNHLKYRWSKRCSACKVELFKKRCLDRRTVVNGAVLYPVGNSGDPWFKELKKQQFEKQKGICPICDKQMLLSKTVFDHDHNTGECRELLHRGCNVVVGWAERDPEIPYRVTEYLKKYKFKVLKKSA